MVFRLISSISAYGGGCKDPSSDEHAAIVGYSDAMGPFCRNKRAAAAFWWFTLRSFPLSHTLLSILMTGSQFRGPLHSGLSFSLSEQFERTLRLQHSISQALNSQQTTKKPLHPPTRTLPLKAIAHQEIITLRRENRGCLERV